MELGDELLLVLRIKADVRAQTDQQLLNELLLGHLGVLALEDEQTDLACLLLK